MVLLITGASHTGKTLLAQRLLQTYRYPCLSMDLLKMGLIRSGNTRLTPEDDRELESYLWPIVREIIKTAIENRQDLIVEGCYVPPRWSQDFTPSYLREIRFCCLVMTKAYIETHFADIQKYACAAERRIDETIPALSAGIVFSLTLRYWAAPAVSAAFAAAAFSAWAFLMALYFSFSSAVAMGRMASRGQTLVQSLQPTHLS